MQKTKYLPRTRLEGDKAEQRKAFYRTDVWRKARAAQLSKQPLCEVCLALDKINLATEVHHQDSFTNYHSQAVATYKALDPSNLMSICRYHHSKIHAILEQQGMTTTGQTPEQIVKIIREYDQKNNVREITLPITI